METGSKERLHRLIDALPSGELLAGDVVSDQALRDELGI